MKVKRIWDHIAFDDRWQGLDTAVLDDIAPSWFERRETLVANSADYATFMDRLKRRHAIETGVVERMYDIEKGVTETLIKEGFLASLVSHGDTNIDNAQLFRHLQDHLEAIQFVFDVVKDNRPLTKGFILELHQLTTRNQRVAEGRDQFGNRTQLPLLRGKFKVRENNPTREDGTLIYYCPPEHVDAEMDRLITVYQQLEADRVHPLVIASWVHHAFTTIHPFQDGNGRVIRLIASLILIKHNYFPITVLREEAKEKYIFALEAADAGAPQQLVTYFGEIQRRNIEAALNLREVAATSLTDVTEVLKKKVREKAREATSADDGHFANRRQEAYNISKQYLQRFQQKVAEGFGPSVGFHLSGQPFGRSTPDQQYRQQLIDYAGRQDYFFNLHLPVAYLLMAIDVREQFQYELVVALHHYGYDESTLAIAGFLTRRVATNPTVISVALNGRPFVFSIADDARAKGNNIENYLEHLLTVALAQIASEL